MTDTVFAQVTDKLNELIKSPEIEDHWVSPLQLNKVTPAHQCVLFLKPEATAANLGVNVPRILEIVLESLDRYEVQVGAVRLLNSEYLRRFELMDQHYGVINRISREGRLALSDDASAALEKEFKEELTAGATVLGGHQFVERFPAFSPFALNVLSDNIGTKKLAGGTYCIKVVMTGSTYLVLNPFHPFQLEHFTGPGKGIVVIEGLSNTPWHVLRRQLIGATNPMQAEEGSIRRTLVEQRQKLGIPEVTQGCNGIHLSAGPLEGMVEFRRFFSDHRAGLIPFSNTVFGKELQARGLSLASIELLAGNPTVPNGQRSVSVFDLTEDSDGTIAAQELARLFPLVHEFSHA